MTGLPTCLQHNPLVSPEIFDHAAPLDLQKRDAIQRRAADLDVAAHVAANAAFDPTRSLGVRTWSCTRRHGAHASSRRQQVRLRAAHAVIRAARLARVSLILWSDTFVSWMETCSMSDDDSELVFMVPYDTMAMMPHFALFYVSLSFRLWILISF